MNTENKKIGNLEEVIIINSDEESEKDENIHQHKKKCEHKRKNKSDHAKRNRLRISQRVELDKDKLGYVINVNAKISDIKDKKQSKHSHKNKQNRPDYIKRNCKKTFGKCKDKIVPGCLRRQCSSLIRCKAFDCREKKAKERLFSKQNFLREKYEKVSKKSERNHRRKRSPNYIAYKSYMLSSISSSSLKENSTDGDVTPRSTISYDDISLDSMPFRNNKLDMLIKRTKQRERKMQEEIKSRQVTEHHTTHIESEDENLSVFSCSSVISKATLIVERKLDDTMYSPQNSDLDLLYNVSNKPKHNSHANKHSIKGAKMKNNTLLDSKHNTSEGYRIKNKNKIETYTPNPIQELNPTNYVVQDIDKKYITNNPDCYIKSNYSASSTYVPTYPKSEINLNSENTSNAYSNMPLTYTYIPDSCENEINSYYTTNLNRIDYRYTPENNTISHNKVDYLINSSNNNYNAYTDLNNYPVNLHQAPLSGGIPYNNSIILSKFPENMATRPFLPVKIDSHITGYSHDNHLYDPNKFESWAMGHNPNYPID